MPNTMDGAKDYLDKVIKRAKKMATSARPLMTPVRFTAVPFLNDRYHSPFLRYGQLYRYSN